MEPPPTGKHEVTGSDARSFALSQVHKWGNSQSGRQSGGQQEGARGRPGALGATAAGSVPLVLNRLSGGVRCSSASHRRAGLMLFMSVVTCCRRPPSDGPGTARAGGVGVRPSMRTTGGEVVAVGRGRQPVAWGWQRLVAAVAVAVLPSCKAPALTTALDVRSRSGRRCEPVSSAGCTFGCRMTEHRITVPVFVRPPKGSTPWATPPLLDVAQKNLK